MGRGLWPVVCGLGEGPRWRLQGGGWHCGTSSWEPTSEPPEDARLWPQPTEFVSGWLGAQPVTQMLCSLSPCCWSPGGGGERSPQPAVGGRAPVSFEALGLVLCVVTCWLAPSPCSFFGQVMYLVKIFWIQGQSQFTGQL